MRRVKAWNCAPSRPSNPKHIEFWKADIKLWNNGGNAPLPPQVPARPKFAFPAPSSRASTSQPRPPPIPTQPRAFNTQHRPKPSSPFMPKRPTPAPPPKFTPKVPTPAPPKFQTPEPSTPPPESPPAIPPTTMVDLIETPPPSPTLPQPPSPPAIPSHFDSTPNFTDPPTSTSTSVPDLHPVPPGPHLCPPSRNPNDRTHIEDFKEIVGEELGEKIWITRTVNEADKFDELGGPPHHVDPRDPTIALTEAMFSLLTTHWGLWRSYNPDECLARKILTNQLKNLVAQDMLYRLSGAKHIRPAHYDFPPVDNPDLTPDVSSNPPTFYDSIASGNRNCSDKGKKRAHDQVK